VAHDHEGNTDATASPPKDDDVTIDWNAVAKVGIPGVIAMFLVYRLAVGFDIFESRLKAIEAQHVSAFAASDSAKELAGRSLMTTERILWMLSVMCANDARTAEQRERCLEPR
jgi:hypothetical protein